MYLSAPGHCLTLTYQRLKAQTIIHNVIQEKYNKYNVSNMYHKYIWKTYIYNTATPIWHPSHCKTKVKECTRLAVPSGRINRIGSESLFSRTNCRNWSNQMGGADRIKMSEKRQAIYRIYSCSWCNVNMTFPSLDK